MTDTEGWLPPWEMAPAFFDEQWTRQCDLGGLRSAWWLGWVEWQCHCCFEMPVSLCQRFWGQHCYVKGKVLSSMLRESAYFNSDFTCRAAGCTPQTSSSRIRRWPEAGGGNTAVSQHRCNSAPPTESGVCRWLWRDVPWGTQTLRQRVTCWQWNACCESLENSSPVSICARGCHLLSGDVAASPQVTGGRRESAMAETEPHLTFKDVYRYRTSTV